MPDIEIQLTMAQHSGEGLRGFRAALFNWGSGEKLAEGTVPDDGLTALHLVTPALAQTGRLVVFGPASQDQHTFSNWEMSLPVHLGEDSKLRLLFNPCKEVDMDAYDPAQFEKAVFFSELAAELAGLPDEQATGEAPGEEDRVSGEQRLGCPAITVNIEDKQDANRGYSAYLVMHGNHQGPLTATKTAQPGEAGKRQVSFVVRESPSTTYLAIWPEDDPQDLQVVPLRIAHDATLELVYD